MNRFLKRSVVRRLSRGTLRSKEDNNMCKIPNVTLGIKDLNFTALRGKFIARLTDGREITIPVALFPNIKRMSVRERNKWMILDDQYFTFEHDSHIYSVLDLLRVA